MKILVIHQYYLEKDGAGISRFNQFAKYWTACGHEVTVICGMVHYMTGTKPARYRGKLVSKETLNGIKLVRVFVSDAYNANFFGRMWGYASFMLSACVAIFELPKSDVIIATSPPLHVGVPALLASWLWRRPLVFEVRDLWPESAIEMGVLANPLLIRISYWLEGLLYRASTMISVLTPAFKERLIANKSVPAEKICFLPNGADLDLLIPTESRESVRRSLGIGTETIALYIGAHGAANHLAQILDAAALLEDTPHSPLFLLIGTGMQKADLVARTERDGLHNIRFLDPIPKEKIADIINASDIGLAVLKKAAIFKTVYPNKIFDYMACKKPVICGIDGAARSLVEEARGGIFVEPENKKALAAAVIDLMANPDQGKRYGENGYDFVCRNFSREVIAKKYEDVLGAAVSRFGSERSSRHR